MAALATQRARFLHEYMWFQDGEQVSDSDNTSSVATAQMPVPLQRSSIRRNEYVNIPIPPKVTTTFEHPSTSLSFILYIEPMWTICEEEIIA